MKILPNKLKEKKEKEDLIKQKFVRLLIIIIMSLKSEII
jgi:hypothetical protein